MPTPDFIKYAWDLIAAIPGANDPCLTRKLQEAAAAYGVPGDAGYAAQALAQARGDVMGATAGAPEPAPLSVPWWEHAYGEPSGYRAGVGLMEGGLRAGTPAGSFLQKSAGRLQDLYDVWGKLAMETGSAGTFPAALGTFAQGVTSPFSQYAMARNILGSAGGLGREALGRIGLGWDQPQAVGNMLATALGGRVGRPGLEWLQDRIPSAQESYLGEYPSISPFGTPTGAEPTFLDYLKRRFNLARLLE